LLKKLLQDVELVLTNSIREGVRKLNIRIPFFIADNFLRLLQILK